MIDRIATREIAASTLSLFFSGGCLVCCALPALLVSIGAGAALAGLVSAVPQLIVLSEHKGIVFGVAGAMLALVGVARYVNRGTPCPADPKLALACQRLRLFGTVTFYSSLGIYAVGFFFAFVAARLFG
ncbi:MAG: hypothetical protein EXR11_04565 [Rhodospirillaceae bacterium]|nr:hypothetical protein [Rhodospirillaceae bacterium]